VSDNDLSPLADTEVHYLRSDHVGDEFKIFIGHCGGPVTTPPAVLYVTDANGLFAGAVDMVRLMQLSAHLPSILVVGIGYRMGALIETIEKRTRDFTPTYDPLVASRIDSSKTSA
jgi:predicted alpha/beta superfamily hydrolase